MVMHRVRNCLLRSHGLPLGLLTGAYTVGSAEYLFGAGIRSGFNRRFFSLSLLILTFTLLANAFGPASAIAIVPSLDWWQMKKPFGGHALPIVFDVGSDQWWPLELTKEPILLSGPAAGQMVPDDACIVDAESYEACPASGYTDLLAWVISNADEAIAANVSVNDGKSPIQRVVKSRMTDRHDSVPGAAIATSISRTVTSPFGAFWGQVTSRDFPVNGVIRPRLELPQNQRALQGVAAASASSLYPDAA
ncbi:hypothetical protein BCR34DRAFT_249228 [Clohesyomyces aquaticus]|uniref:Uncharacterized protein n=1 Tax=Clohesyomyces aquaticus TaxID=1231657 RepID=A0A1Y1ZUM0_9PLEO|nr:hypothetical protein BCR34DRAFT_249228 [Clohesyomyces aquaticus]